MYKYPFKKGPIGLFFLSFLRGQVAFLNRVRPASLAMAASISLLIAGLLPLPTTAQARLLPTSTLTLGTATAYVELANTPASRQQGLMFRQSLPSDHGMLFVFEEETSTCFWMKNTPLPLSIAFIDAQGIIINLRDMQPHTETNHCPDRPMRYALEMPQGWFLYYDIAAGQKIQGLPQP